jgi:predicted nucleic acid-binding protein
VIVVDTNVLVYLYVRGQRTSEAEAVLARDPEWMAPILWRSEFRNTLTGLVRQRALQLAEALSIVDEAERQLSGREYTVVSHRVLQLAARSGCSAYDCEFVALAQDLGTSLVTTDNQVLRAFPSLAIEPRAFVNA